MRDIDIFFQTVLLSVEGHVTILPLGKKNFRSVMQEGDIENLGQTYNWKRFWFPRGSAIDLSDGGYLRSPESSWGPLLQTPVVSLDSLFNRTCLILLGEPGSGKTETVQTEIRRATDEIKERGDDLIVMDLRSYRSEDRLVKNLFESSTFTAWIEGDYRLYLFLDSFDECLLRIDTLAALLIDELKKYPVERLSLRIACRTADWPAPFEKELGQLWESHQDAVHIYELAPLRRSDVIEAARSSQIDDRAFLKAVDQKRVVPLALKPITLIFLLKIYAQTRTFPSSQEELYHEGCLLLCTEFGPNRLSSRQTGKLTSEARLIIAARIAAAMIFTNTSAIWSAPDQAEMSEADVSIRDLYGDEEQTKAIRFPVPLAAVEEVLDTGLFSSRGSSRLKWAHKTYAEYLAAWYLVEHRMNFVQVMSLIIHPDDPEEKIVPQLHETTAWLAGMQPHIFQEILKRDPDVLLSSDVATADEKRRMDFVTALFRLSDEERTHVIARHSLREYAKLAHSNLVGQLQPFIEDRSQSLSARLLAINIAEACELQMLQQLIATVALDLTEPLWLRETASHAIVHVGDSTTKILLKALALQQPDDDLNDQLKGYGLQATWPNHMTAEELFSALTPPRSQHFFGAYESFLVSQASMHFQVSDLSLALAWTERRQDTGTRIPPSDMLSKIQDAIMIEAWSHLDSPEVLQGFVRTILACLKHYNAFIDTHDNKDFALRIEQEDQKRHRLLEDVFHLMANQQREATELLMCKPSLLFWKDIPWMLDIFSKRELEDIQPLVAQLLWRLVNRDDAEQMYTVFTVCETSPILASAFSFYLLPVNLNSPQAQQMKEDYLRDQQLQEKMQVRAQIAAFPSMDRVASLLQECEQKDINLWVHVIYELTYRPDGSPYQEQWDHETFLGWQRAGEAIKAKMLEVATRYIQTYQAEAHKWKESQTVPYSSWAMYKSLQLVLQEQHQVVLTFPVEVWQQVAPAFLWWSKPHEVPGDRLLLMIGYTVAPTSFIEAMLLLVDVNNSLSELLHKMELHWDDRIAEALLEEAQDEQLPAEKMGDLLRILLSHGVEQAHTLAASFVPVPLPADQEERTRALVAAHALLTYAHDAGWSLLWPLFRDYEDFCLQLLSRGASEPNLAGMTEQQVADLYIWLVRQRPPSRYPIQTSGFIGATDRLALLRNTLLTHLQHRGTFEACEAIQSIMQAFPEPDPELPYMLWVLREAQRMARRRTWVPLRIEELLQMIRHREKRLVQNGDHLLEVLLESLQRLEAKLQGETPAVIDLWNTPTDKKTKKVLYTPKDENRFSDYVKRHFDDDLAKRGIIVNREVELRSGLGSSPGERTDIHVDAAVRSSSSNREAYEVITVIIEVKGCWHKELKQAMATQLVDRYLKENNSCQHGLYLVGWFRCDQWDEADYRKADSPKWSLEKARNEFDTQAAGLSYPARHIKAYVMNTALR